MMKTTVTSNNYNQPIFWKNLTFICEIQKLCSSHIVRIHALKFQLQEFLEFFKL